MLKLYYNRRRLRAIERSLDDYTDALEAGAELYTEDLTREIREQALKIKRTGELARGIENRGAWRRGDAVGGRVISTARYSTFVEGGPRMRRRAHVKRAPSRFRRGKAIRKARKGFFRKGRDRADRRLFARLAEAWERHFGAV